MASSAGLRHIYKRSKENSTGTSTNSSSPNHTRHLVVCGGAVTKDVWLFGDFFGFVTTLKEHGVHETFINTFDIDKYFRETDCTDIKFGHDDSFENDPFLKYTRREWEHRPTPWIQVKLDEASSRVLEWVREQANNAKPKDIVSIILIGHGRSGCIQLGKTDLFSSDLAAACSLFHMDVQVNIIVNSCYSGSFARAFRVSNQRNIYVHTSAKVGEKSYSTPRSISGRHRNSLFGQAFVQTLGLTRDINENWTLQKQKTYVQETSSMPSIPGLKVSTPVVVSDSPVTRLMKDILFRDYADISFSNAPTRARRVLSPTNEALSLLRQQDHHERQRANRNEQSSAEYEAACDIIGSEMNRINLDFVDRGDEGVTTDWCTLSRIPSDRRAATLAQLARVTWFRWKVQESFFRAAEELIRADLISLDAIYMPMVLCQLTPSTSAVVQVLRCFSIAKSCMDYYEEILGTNFFAPAVWLATLIVRSCSNWTRIVNRLTTVPLLGELDSELALEVKMKRRVFKINPDEGKIIEDGLKMPSYAFWLPFGVRMEAYIPVWTERYSKLMGAYHIVTGMQWEDFDDVKKCMDNLLAMEMLQDVEAS